MMKKKKVKKSKLFTLILAFCVTVILATGTSIAYFTDSKEQTSVFTAGSVYIEMTEAQVKKDSAGNLIEDTSKDRIVAGALDANTVNDYGAIFPGQSIYKDPTVKNTGSENAWLAMKVVITDGVGDIHDIFGYETGDEIDFKALFGGGIIESSTNVMVWHGMNARINDTYAMVQKSSRADGRYEFFFFMINPLVSGEEVTLFSEMFIPMDLTNEEMKEFVQLTVTVQAFAVQTYGFENAYQAVRAAFPDYFSNCQ